MLIEKNGAAATNLRMSGRQTGRSSKDHTKNHTKSTDIAVYPLTLHQRRRSFERTVPSRTKRSWSTPSRAPQCGSHCIRWGHIASKSVLARKARGTESQQAKTQEVWQDVHRYGILMLLMRSGVPSWDELTLAKSENPSWEER